VAVKKGEEKDEIVYTREDLERNYGNLYTLFNAIEFAHNKVQLISTKTDKSKESRSFFDTIDALSKLDWNNIRQSLDTIMEEAGKAVKGPQTQEQTKNE
jgi:hypothetical protein